MTTEKKFEKGTWQGSRDRENSTVQTAAMGQIGLPHSTERILGFKYSVESLEKSRYDYGQKKLGKLCFACDFLLRLSG